jgi:hypothetical protein
MSLRQEISILIEQLTDEQLAQLLPLIMAFKEEAISSQSSQAYQAWVSSENDIYDQVFADELAAR